MMCGACWLRDDVRWYDQKDGTPRLQCSTREHVRAWGIVRCVRCMMRDGLRTLARLAQSPATRPALVVSRERHGPVSEVDSSRQLSPGAEVTIIGGSRLGASHGSAIA